VLRAPVKGRGVETIRGAFLRCDVRAIERSADPLVFLLPEERPHHVILLLGGSDVSVAVLFEAPSPVPFGADLTDVHLERSPRHHATAFPPD